MLRSEQMESKLSKTFTILFCTSIGGIGTCRLLTKDNVAIASFELCVSFRNCGYSVVHA